MAEWVEMHHACSKCESSDAASTDSEGWTHCFSCQQTYRAEGAESNTTVHDAMNIPRTNASLTNQAPTAILPEGAYKAVPDRKISERTCRL